MGRALGKATRDDAILACEINASSLGPIVTSYDLDLDDKAVSLAVATFNAIRPIAKLTAAEVWAEAARLIAEGFNPYTFTVEIRNGH